MKIRRRFKAVLFFVLYGLYFTGLVDWVLQNWFQVDLGFGFTSRPSAIWFLRAHAVFGMAFMMIFGYLFRTHVQPGLRTRRQLASGLSILTPIILLIFTVPFLYYSSGESFKSAIALGHTYLGLVLFLPFLIHAYQKTSS